MRAQPVLGGGLKRITAKPGDRPAPRVLAEGPMSPATRPGIGTGAFGPELLPGLSFRLGALLDRPMPDTLSADLSPPAARLTPPRSSWTREDIAALYHAPLPDLMAEAMRVHRANFDPREIQLSQLLSIKTGGCPEDCGYCSQAAKFDTGVKATKLLELSEVTAAAASAKAQGATRFCLGAAFRSPKDKDIEAISVMIAAVKDMGLETCATLGMVTGPQAGRLRQAGLDYYNHNLDTSPEYYPEMVTTRRFEDRLETLANARAAGIKLCCGGILGMGEAVSDRVGLIHALASLDPHPESVPINRLAPMKGTPLAGSAPLDDLELVRAIAVARVVMPRSFVRLSAGRETMSAAVQALCFLAGANSIFVGAKLLTSGNPAPDADHALLAALGLYPMGAAPAGASGVMMDGACPAAGSRSCGDGHRPPGRD